MSTTARHIAVLQGGWSGERTVSLVSGDACAAALARAGYRVTQIDAGHDLAQTLASLQPDVVFNALHGQWGEDGCVQGLLECLALPYTHSGVLASALAMNKERAKDSFRAHNLPVAQSLVVSREEAASGCVMEAPYVVKPVNQGSSIGVHVVREGDNYPPAGRDSGQQGPDEMVMVERYIPGRELTCAVMGEEVFDVMEIVPRASSFYNYDSKYDADGSGHILPASIDDALRSQVRQVTLKAHQALGCRGVSRADFRYDDTRPGSGELVLLEINTQPGMTPLSLVPELAQWAGYSFEALVSWIVEDASCLR